MWRPADGPGRSVRTGAWMILARLAEKMTMTARLSHWAFLAAALVPASLVLAEGDAHSESVSLFAGDFGNAIWTLAIFALLLIVLGKFAWGPILKALQQRESFIHDSLSQAKKDRLDAEARLKDLDARLASARDEATGIVNEGRKDAEALKRKIEHDARQEADAMVERAKREIGLARDSAVNEIYSLTAALATSAAGKIIAKEIDPQRHEQLITDSIAELSKGASN